eukprot:TRINITY_DN9588_c1_g1_i2.p2 TRINITY_DN9588_c1_g1~~TRINITY_DN9588_c1_g1_i2.p2  ORF type:complete len:212 (+),score=53.57 TRINITY_DN9588_c1_g1_i2:207-842(+)
MEAVHHFTQKMRASPDGAFHSLEWMGFRIGHGWAERSARDLPLSNGSTRTLDAIKHVCKELWKVFFKRPANGLRWNKKDTYIVVDEEFRWLRSVSHTAAEKWVPGQSVVVTRNIEFQSGAGIAEGTTVTVIRYPGDESGTVEVELKSGKRYDAKEKDLTVPDGDPVRIDPVGFLSMPCGIIRGYLYAVGVPATVEAKVANVRGAEFFVHLK